MIYTVDRIEGGVAVCLSDSGEVREITLSSIEYKLAEGDVFEISDGSERKLTRRDDEKKVRSDRNKKLFDKLKQKGKTK